MIILTLAKLQICFSHLVFSRVILKIHIKRCDKSYSGINFSFFYIFRYLQFYIYSFLKLRDCKITIKEIHLEIFFLNDLYAFYTIKRRRASEFSQSLLIVSLHLHIAVEDSNFVLLSTDISNMYLMLLIITFFEDVKYIWMKLFIQYPRKLFIINKFIKNFIY